MYVSGYLKGTVAVIAVHFTIGILKRVASTKVPKEGKARIWSGKHNT